MALQSNLDPQKACGPDDIPTIVVKRCFMDLSWINAIIVYPL